MNRYLKVIEKLKENNIDTLLITDPYAIDYLIDYLNFPHERVYVLALSAHKESMLFFNNLFYVDKKLPFPITWFDDKDDALSLIADYLKNDQNIAVDKQMPARWLLPLQKQLKKQFVLGSEYVDHVRQIKDNDEREKMRKASQINDQAMDHMYHLLSHNYSEEEMVGHLLETYKSMNATGFSFDPIFGYGKNGSDPHHSTDDTHLKPGDSIIVDMGCMYDSYASDMTRTFFYKEVSNEQIQVYNLVLKANQEAIKAIKPGVKLSDIDKIARDIITEGGYGAQFNHRLGHFIGRECHEYGDVSSSSDIIARDGMCFSIEPGIYIPGKFGVRIEDLVLVTKDGVEVLNNYPKELRIVK